MVRAPPGPHRCRYRIGLASSIGRQLAGGLDITEQNRHVLKHGWTARRMHTARTPSAEVRGMSCQRASAAAKSLTPERCKGKASGTGTTGGWQGLPPPGDSSGASASGRG